MTGVNTALLACSPPAFSKLLPASVKPVPGYITQQPAELLRDRTTGFRSTSPAVSTQLVNTTPGQSPWRALSPGLTEVAQKFLVLYHLPSKLENNWVLVKEMEPMLKNNVMLQKSKIEIGKSREKYSLFVSSLLWLNDHSVSAMYYCSLKHGLPCSHKIGCQGSTWEQFRDDSPLAFCDFRTRKTQANQDLYSDTRSVQAEFRDSKTSDFYSPTVCSEVPIWAAMVLNQAAHQCHLGSFKELPSAQTN